jgi:hypothetical protein
VSEEDPEPGRLERHVNASEYWLQRAGYYDFPSPIRTECLQLAAIHASLAGALAATEEGSQPERFFG